MELHCNSSHFCPSKECWFLSSIQGAPTSLNHYPPVNNIALSVFSLPKGWGTKWCIRFRVIFLDSRKSSTPPNAYGMDSIRIALLSFLIRSARTRSTRAKTSLTDKGTIRNFRRETYKGTSMPNVRGGALRSTPGACVYWMTWAANIANGYMYHHLTRIGSLQKTTPDL